MSRHARCCDDSGVVGGAEVLPFGVLVFVIGTLLVANVWATVDASTTASSAAREAIRAYVEAPDAQTARSTAHLAAATAVSGHGRDPERLRLEIHHPDGRAWGRCVPVTVTAHYEVALALVPGTSQLASRTVSARQSELIDPWRSGMAGQGC